MNKSKYGCASAYNMDTCDNRLLIKRKEEEERNLKGLKQKLTHPAWMAEFVREYQREWNRLQVENRFSHTRLEAELRSVSSKIAKIVDAILAFSAPENDEPRRFTGGASFFGCGSRI